MKKTLVVALLTPLARLYLWRFRPRIVGITGNSGKTTTKEAVAAVLATKHRIRASGGNMNNELGMPATIIGNFADEYYRIGGTWMFWLGVVVRGVIGLFQSAAAYPDVLVLEYGSGKPGDIKYLVRRFPPHVSVVTQIGEVPVHVEFFASPQHLAMEKMQIIRHLGAADHAVLNYDDQTVLDMREHTRARVRTFGLGYGADVRAEPTEIGCDINANGAAMPLAISGTLGRGIITACAAAVAVGDIFNVGLADAAQALSHMRPPAGRMRVLRGIKGTTIIDDTYNASPAAMHLAIDTIRQAVDTGRLYPPVLRKVLVLGDMLELGGHSVQAHQAVGTLAATVADELVCVGERARLYAEAASNQIDKSHIQWFCDSMQAASAVQALIRPGDTVLVKGSQGMRMERVVKEIMAEPDRAAELLVRQSALWLAK